MPWFVNLPLSFIPSKPDYLALFLDKGLCPELGVDAEAMDRLDLGWHRDMAARFRDAGLACAVHLPFMDLRPGSLDDLILEATRERLRRAVDVAALYAPHHMVAHPLWIEEQHAAHEEAWLERSEATWTLVREAWPQDDPPPLFLENVFDRTPDRLAALVRRLRRAWGNDTSTGVCFDAGHWFSFGGGSGADPDGPSGLAAWLDGLAPVLGHLHLHDNDGSGDQHLGLGLGAIPWEGIREGLDLRGVHPGRSGGPGVTLEPHDRVSFDRSMAYLAARPGFLGLRVESV